MEFSGISWVDFPINRARPCRYKNMWAWDVQDPLRGQVALHSQESPRSDSTLRHRQAPTTASAASLQLTYHRFNVTYKQVGLAITIEECHNNGHFLVFHTIQIIPKYIQNISYKTYSKYA